LKKGLIKWTSLVCILLSSLLPKKL
jgi:hypothetical protein